MRTILCREGLYYLAMVALVFMGAILREVNLLLLFGALLACPVFIAWRLERKIMDQLKVYRKKPTGVVAGEVFHIPIEITNPRKKLSSWAIVIEDRIRLVRNGNSKKDRSKSNGQSKAFLRHESKTLSPAVYFEYIKAGATLKKSYSGCIPRRGRYKIGPIVASTRFPVGFFRTSMQLETELDQANEFLVFPRWGKMTSNWYAKQHQSDENKQHRKQLRSSRVTGEFLGVRHWQSGDIKKWIHWRASAKHNELVVRQYEQHQNRDASIILDLYQPSSPSIREMEHIELAVSVAATLVNELARRGGSNLLLGTFGNTDADEKDKTLQSGVDVMIGQICVPLIESMMKRLAVIEPTDDDALPALLLQMLSSSDPSADMFFVTHTPPDFERSDRFQSLRNDPRFRVLTQRIKIIDTSSPTLDEIFMLD